MKFDNKIYKRAKQLDGGSWLKKLSKEQVENAYNGIGADWMPKTLRDAITKAWSIFEPAALIHDCEYSYKKTRTKNEFDFVNNRFYRNCQELVKEKHGWWCPMRYLLLRRAKMMYECLSAFGWKAWKEATKCK